MTTILVDRKWFIMTKIYCSCGCGGEIKKWKNGRISPFLRGHHMRGVKSYNAPPKRPFYCKCGCGEEIFPLKNGHVNSYVKNHHTRNVKFSMEARAKRIKKRWGYEPILSPYLKNVFIRFNQNSKRWYASITKDKKTSASLHSTIVYKHYFGDIPKGFVVHHKNGKHETITDDRPENLMLLPDEWNLRFFPVLAKGFGIPESVVTETYIEIYKDYDKKTLFSKLCERLIGKNK